MDEINVVKRHIAITELHRLCRTCLKHDGVIDLYRKNFKGFLFCDLLSKLYLLKVEKDDGYPEKICKMCADMVAQIFCFSETIKDNQDTLRIAFGIVNTSVQSDHSYSVEVESTNDDSYIKLVNNCFVAPESADATAVLNKDDMKIQQIENIKKELSDILICNLNEETITLEIKRDDDMMEEIVTDQVKKSVRKYKCKNCDIIFDNLKEYLTHKNQEKILNNEIETQYKCKFCKEVFTSRLEYRFHKTKELKRKSMCPLCKKTMHPTKLEDHLRIEHRRGPPIKCKICSRRFLSRPRYESHLRAHEAGFFCDICGQHCFKRSSLLRHVKSHEPKVKKTQSNICDKCGKGFKYPYMLRDHLATHSYDRLFLCSVCGMTFTNQSYLYHHNLKEHAEKPFVCNICGYKFLTEKGLKDHQKSPCTVKKTEKVDCKICNEEVDQKYFRTHVETHSSEYSFLCYWCSIGFSNEKEYEYHKEQVHPPKTVCAICNKSFKDPLGLKNHYRHHSEERPYECNECGKRFKTRANIYAHKQGIHSLEKKFKCQYCNKGFALKGPYRQHEANHLKPKKTEV